MTLHLWMWRGAKLVGLLFAIGMIGLIIWLANGGADLPRHPEMIIAEPGIPSSISGAALTISISASTRSSAQPWGIDLGPVRFLVHPDGYVYVGDGGDGPIAWREFPHVNGGRNELYVHADASGVRFFVNRELVTRIPPPGLLTVTLIGAPDALTNLLTSIWRAD